MNLFVSKKDSVMLGTNSQMQKYFNAWYVHMFCPYIHRYGKCMERLNIKERLMLEQGGHVPPSNFFFFPQKFFFSKVYI